MKKILGIIILGLLLCGNAYANVKILECKQIIEIDADIGDDLIIKHIVEINLDSKSIETSCTSCNNADKTLFEISNISDVSIEAIIKPKPDHAMQVISLNRYTLELKYHLYNADSVYEGASIFECNKLEKKI